MGLAGRQGRGHLLEARCGLQCFDDSVPANLFYYIKWLILLSVILLSGVHFNGTLLSVIVPYKLTLKCLSLGSPDSMPLEGANRSWMVHQMRLSEYFINNHRMRVSVLLLLLLRFVYNSGQHSQRIKRSVLCVHGVIPA